MEVAVAPIPELFGFELRFQSLFHEGRALAFPCDAAGLVKLDALSERARENYLYARVVIAANTPCQPWCGARRIDLGRVDGVMQCRAGGPACA